MAGEHHIQNNTYLTLASGITAGDTTLAFTTGHGARLDTIASPDFCFATLVRAATGELERVKITAHAAAADSCTVTRAADGTTALTFIAGDKLELRAGKADWQQNTRLGLIDNVVAAGGTADAITATLANTGLQALPDKFIIFVAGTSPAATNLTNAPTFNLTLNAVATAAKAIVKGDQLPLAGGDVPAVAMLMYRSGTDNWTLLNPYYGALQAGDYVDSANPTVTTRTGFLLPDGTAVSRTSNAALLSAITKSATFTVTIASPGVVTCNAHGIPENGEVTLSTTSALPTGLGSAIRYYAHNVSANTLELSATPGGASINTSGVQSGVHTIRFYPHGAGDGSTTFNVPDRRDRVRKGQGAGAFAISVDAAQVSLGSDTFTIPSNVDSLVTGLKGQFTNSGGALPTSIAALTDYWLVRISDTTFKVATSLANAQNGTVIDLITSAGSGVHTFTQNNLSTRTVGQKGGEEAHAESSVEQLSHDHSLFQAGANTAAALNIFNNQANPAFSTPRTGFTGGNAAMNNESPYGIDAFWIKT